MSSQHSNPKKPIARGAWFLALALPVAGLGWVGTNRSWFGEKPRPQIDGASVRRGPLLISILARGDLSAADSFDLRSEVEGRTTILTLLPEGTHVHKGDLVCELDATPLIERRFQQSIAVRNAEAAHVKARQNYEIQKSQNRSDIAKATQQLEFAALDLEKFLEGEKESQLEKARQEIDLAKEDAARAETKLGWSEKLAAKGFLTSSELETDRIANHRASVVLQQVSRDLELLLKFQMPRMEAELKAAHTEAEYERERVELQAKARIVDFEADLSTNEAKLGLEKEKLAKLETQITKARIHAPHPGLLVYAQLDSDEPPIQEGTEVREREIIASIPSASGMIAQAKLHESVLDQVSLGMPCTVTVEAIPGREFTGKVSFVAILPDQNTRWSNPNTRLYRTDVAIDSASGEMRPGMSCSIRIRVEEVPDTLYVPVQAVFHEPRGNVSYVSTPTGIEVRPVTIGRYTVDNVQILAGLSEGETVLLSRPNDFREGEAEDESPDATTAKDAEKESASKTD
ncbi:MAG TPA: efflux RND transporter periplasmic adaptor subunit [Planctomycetota bacterium]|nr:efflux RND transporter periplasmic adaptor subunit [Planctomycetota bacterium]